jgi:hypothetical protein
MAIAFCSARRKYVRLPKADDVDSQKHRWPLCWVQDVISASAHRVRIVFGSIVAVMRISPDYLGSEEALRDHAWLPGEPRPTTHAIARKHTTLTADLQQWTSPDAFISHAVFETPASVTHDGKSHAEVPLHGVVLRPNAWAYQIPPGTHHDVLWVADGKRWDDADVDRQLLIFLPRFAQYVWYDNPKPSFTHGHELRHVQVLWRPRSTPLDPAPKAAQSVQITCVDDGTVFVDASLLRVFSSAMRGEISSWSSVFTTKKVNALLATLEFMVGRYAATNDLQYATLCEALGPAWSYGMHGVLAYGLRCLAAYESFRTQEEDMAFQSAILWYDAHEYTLPDNVRLRMVKTFIGSSWIGAPYMWKLSTDALLPGFPITRLRSRLLFDLRRIARNNDDTTRMSPVDIVLRIRYSHRMLIRWRQRRQALGARGS